MLLAYVQNSKLNNANKDGFPILGHIIIVKVRNLSCPPFYFNARVAFSLPVPTEMAILKGVVHVTDTPTSRG